MNINFFNPTPRIPVQDGTVHVKRVTNGKYKWYKKCDISDCSEVVYHFWTAGIEGLIFYLNPKAL